MRDTLIDIQKSDPEVIQQFIQLHNDFGEFVHRGSKSPVDIPKIIRYITLCYDKESNVVASHKIRWTDRKREAAISAGFLEDGVYIEGSEDILYGKQDDVNKLIVRYLSLQFDKDFMMYAVLQEILMSSTTELLNFKFARPSDATKAKSNVEAIRDDIESLEEKILSGGDVNELKIALYEHVQKFTVADLRPENIVTRLENGERLVDDTPYGSYVPEKQKFLNDE